MADMPTAEVLIAKIVFWIVWIGFIVSAVDTLQFAPFQGLVDEFFRFVPRFLVALLVLSLGFLVGNFLWRATLLASVNAGLPGARLLSGALRVLVIAIGVVMALEQLGLATAVVLTAFAITFGALDAGTGDRVRAGRARRREATARAAVRRRRKNGTRTPRRTCNRGDRHGHTAQWRSVVQAACSSIRHRCRAASASAISAPAPSSSSICSRPPASDCGRCCRSGRPATATPRISAFPRLPAIRC